MATLLERGNKFNVIYEYKGADNEPIQLWESYTDEMQAVTRKAVIDLLQKQKDYKGIRNAALEYKRKKAKEKISKNSANKSGYTLSLEEKMSTTFSDFVDKFLPVYIRKNNIQGSTYNGYKRNIELHIKPYFGDYLPEEITVQDFDQFVNHLRQKRNSRKFSRDKTPEEIPFLSSSTINKICSNFLVIMRGAKEWGYLTEMPDVDVPAAEYQIRESWTKSQLMENLEKLDDKILHLAVHLIFVASLRSGEAVGLEIKSIKLDTGQADIYQTLERLNDDAIELVNPNDIYKKFPKLTETSKSQLVLKKTKTKTSIRCNYLTEPLIEEIKERIAEIERCKDFYGAEYNDHGLLICQVNGNPIEPKLLERKFKKWQKRNDIMPEIEIQGIRKSSSMYKLRVSGNNYQEVQMDTGHSTPKVLMKHYNEVYDEERKGLSGKIQEDLYTKQNENSKDISQDNDVNSMIERVKENPEMAKIMTSFFQQIQSVQ